MPEPIAEAPIAEVIESSTRQFVAEVVGGREAPAFGSWVEVMTEGGVTLYGLVSHVETGSAVPGRQATALGMDREQRRLEMPQLVALIRTTLRAQTLAYREPDGPAGPGALRQTLPPHPADLHDFVFACGPEAVADLAHPYDFLRTLVRNPDPAVPVDDLTVAVLRGLWRAHGRGDAGRVALREAGRALSRLLNDDHERLQSVLRRAAA